VLAGSQNLIADQVPLVDFVLLRQEFHGEVNALEFAAGNRQVAGGRGAAGEQQRVIIAAQLFDRDIDADVGIGAELDPLGPHLVDAPPDARLFELEVGNAIHQQSARAVGSLEDRDAVPGAVELLRGR